MEGLKDESYYEKLDKRTKEYKLFKEAQEKVIEQQSKGAGDVVEGVLEATGIASAFKAVFGEDCGCEERKDALNELLPNHSKVCLLYTSPSPRD